MAGISAARRGRAQGGGFLIGMRTSRYIQHSIAYVIIAIFLLISLMPLGWMISAAFKTLEQMRITIPIQWIPQPRHPRELCRWLGSERLDAQPAQHPDARRLRRCAHDDFLYPCRLCLRPYEISRQRSVDAAQHQPDAHSRPGHARSPFCHDGAHGLGWDLAAGHHSVDAGAQSRHDFCPAPVFPRHPKRA